MEELKTEMIHALEQKIDRRISYKSISPSVFGYLGIRELTIYSYYDAQEVLLRISRVKVYYNIFRFLSTRAPVLALSEIQIANSYFEIDYDRDRELIEFLDSLRTGNAAGGDSSVLSRLAGGASQADDRLPQIDISGTNITILYRYGEWHLRVSNLFFDVARAEQFYEIAVRGFLEARRARGELSASWLSTRVKASGKLGRLFTWSDLAVRLYSLSTDTIDLKRQTFQVSYDTQKLTVRKIQDRSPLDIQFLYDTESKDLNFQFNAEDFQPSDLFQMTGELDRFNSYLESTLSASGSIEANLEEFRFRYDGEVELELPGKLLPFELSFSSRISGNERIMYLSPLILDSSRGRVEFIGNILISNLFPSGLLRIDDFQPLVGQYLSARFSVRRAAQSLSVEGSSLSLGETIFDSFLLDLTPGNKQLEFVLDAAMTSVEVPGSIAAAGSLSWHSGMNLTASGLADSIPLGTLYGLLGPQSSRSKALEKRLSSYTVSASVKGSTNLKSFSLAADRVEIVEVGKTGNSIRFSLEADNKFLELKDLQAAWEGYDLAGSIAARRQEKGVSVDSLLWFETVPYKIELQYLPDRELRISGSYGLEGYYRFRETVQVAFPGTASLIWGNPFRLRSENLPIPLQKSTMYASLDIEGLIEGNGSPYVRSGEAQLRNIPLRVLNKNSMALSFQLYNKQLSVDRIVYKDAVSTLVGSGTAEVEDVIPLRGKTSIQLESPEGAERYSVAGRIDNKEIEGSLSFSQAPMKRAGVEVVSGNISGSVSAVGSLPDPDLQIRLALEEGRLNLDPLELDLAVEYSAESIRLSSFNLTFLNHKIKDGEGRFDFNSGGFFFRSHYRADYFEQIVNLEVDLNGVLSGVPLRFDMKNLLDREIEGSLKLADITIDQRSVPDWVISLEAAGGTLDFIGGPREAIRGRLSGEGGFNLTLLDPLPIQGRAEGTIVKDKLESSFSVDALDMRIINTLTPTTDIFTFTTGSAQGTLRIFGSVNDPDWIGYLDVSGAELLFKPSPDPVKPINGRLLFEGKSFSLPRTTSFSGKSKIEGEGIFYLDHWVPEALELIFYAEQYPGVHIRDIFGPVSVDGFATGAVRIRADKSAVLLDGKIDANSCSIAVQRQEDVVETSLAAITPLSVAMEIKTGRSVEFYWPAVNFPIVRTYAKQGEEVTIDLEGQTGAFRMKGEVEIRGGEVFYFDRSFYLRQGSITFEESLEEFDPWIYALAEIRERDLNNEELKIYLEANNKLSLFSPRFYSEPSRSDVEILNLIGGTILNRFEQTDFGTAAVMLTSDIIGQFGILTPFERAVRKVLNLDLFTVRTQFLQNVLIGKIRGENLAENTFNPLDNTTLTLGKYLGTDLFLEALVRFQSTDDLTDSSNIRTEGELNLEWVTPFFLLEWTLTPMHPENLFLSDNSIGLSWKYSY